uniref:Uncharacterized protein n=1 Tax=Arundo donax TaxID=35708 RepID=A0A0A9EGG0_ARUDO
MLSSKSAFPIATPLSLMLVALVALLLETIRLASSGI